MRINELLLNITDEISSCLADLKEDQLEALEKEIKASSRIFVVFSKELILSFLFSSLIFTTFSSQSSTYFAASR